MEAWFLSVLKLCVYECVCVKDSTKEPVFIHVTRSFVRRDLKFDVGFFFVASFPRSRLNKKNETEENKVVTGDK